jgi:hypothetical protein
MIRKLGVILLIAFCHFGLSVLVVPLTLAVSRALTMQQPESSPLIQLLVILTGILHFPIVSLSLYSRMWFPGNWIYVPILINSFSVASGGYLFVVICKKIFQKHD